MRTADHCAAPWTSPFLCGAIDSARRWIFALEALYSERATTRSWHALARRRCSRRLSAMLRDGRLAWRQTRRLRQFPEKDQPGFCRRGRPAGEPSATGARLGAGAPKVGDRLPPFYLPDERGRIRRPAGDDRERSVGRCRSPRTLVSRIAASTRERSPRRSRASRPPADRWSQSSPTGNGTPTRSARRRERQVPDPGRYGQWLRDVAQSRLLGR